MVTVILAINKYEFNLSVSSKPNQHSSHKRIADLEMCCKPSRILTTAAGRDLAFEMIKSGIVVP